MAKLEGDAIARALETLPGWRHERGALVRTVETPSYRAAQRFVNRMADLAEGANHHPDLTWSYRRLSVSLTTHDRGGVTKRDIRLAALLDEVLVELGWIEASVDEASVVEASVVETSVVEASVVETSVVEAGVVEAGGPQYDGKR